MVPLPLLLLLQTGGPGVEFRPPVNWLPVEAPPLQAFAPRDLSPGQLLVMAVGPAEPVGTGEFAAWFQHKMAGPGETILQQSDVEDRSANGLQVRTVTQRVQLPQGPVVRVLYGIGSGDRAALAMMTGNQDQLITRYAPAAREFFQSLRFSAGGNNPPPPAAGATTVTAIPRAGFEGSLPRGLFYRLQAGGGRMETRTRLFLPPDRVTRVEPMGGSTFDLARCSPDTCGRYRVEGATLTLQWDNGRSDRLAFARSGDGFRLDGDEYQPARGLSREDAVGTWVNPGGASATLQLRADQTFQWGGGSEATTLRGRYSIEGLALILAFTDGTSRRYTLFAAGPGRPPGLVSMDGTVFNRK